jgi:hypothetical protein
MSQKVARSILVRCQRRGLNPAEHIAEIFEGLFEMNSNVVKLIILPDGSSKLRTGHSLNPTKREIQKSNIIGNYLDFQAVLQTCLIFNI